MNDEYGPFLVHKERIARGMLWRGGSKMLSNISFRCTRACLLAALVLMILSVGCSGGTPISPDIMEIQIVSPVSNSEWGSPQGVWQIVFTPIIYWTVTDFDYAVEIDAKEVEVVTPPYGDSLKMLSVIVQDLDPGDHQLTLSAIHFNRTIAKGEVIFTIKPDRKLTIEITEPNSETDWDIGDTVTVSWESNGTSSDNYDVVLSLGGSDLIILGQTTGKTLLECEVPVLDYPGRDDFTIKVVANDGMAEANSDDFTIDYGPVVKLTIIAPKPVISISDVFTLGAEARDKYDNIVKNYNVPLVIFATWDPDSYGTFNCPVIGDGICGSWNDGVVMCSTCEIESATQPPLQAIIMLSDGNIYSDSQLMMFTE